MLDNRDKKMKTQDMNRDWIATARTLNQALPYLQRYAGATVVIKLGGHAMGSDEAMESFASDVVLMRQVGVNPVVVHGGGPMINDMLKRLDIQSEFVNGKRVTDAATMEVVEMVLSGVVNKRIVQAINRAGGRAVGLSGKDANLMTCEQTDAQLGLVGTPSQLDPSILKTLFDQSMIPVIAPLGAGRDGETFNINGDTAAGASAGALKADRLVPVVSEPWSFWTGAHQMRVCSNCLPTTVRGPSSAHGDANVSISHIAPNPAQPTFSPWKTKQHSV
jgi:acetylglutamate kinase